MAGRIRGFITFYKGISLKANVKAYLKFKLTWRSLSGTLAITSWVSPKSFLFHSSLTFVYKFDVLNVISILKWCIIKLLSCIHRSIWQNTMQVDCFFQQLYSHLPPITETNKFRQTRNAGHCWRSMDELISDILLWTPSHGWAKAGRPTLT